MTYISSFVYLHSLLEFRHSSAEAGNRFDVVRLREHIKCVEGVKNKTAVGEGAQVAREGGRVAGDVGYAAGPQREDAFDGLGRAGAGRVEEDEVGGGDAGGATQ